MWVLEAHQGKIHDLAVSSDSRWLAVGGRAPSKPKITAYASGISKAFRGPMTLSNPPRWGESVASPGHQPSVLRGHHGPVLAVAITPDCRWVVTGSEDKTVRLFDLTSHCPAASQVVLRGHAGPVTSIAISPDGRWMVTGSHDQTVRLWDLTTPQPGSRATVLNGHEGGVHLRLLSARRAVGWQLPP